MNMMNEPSDEVVRKAFRHFKTSSGDILLFTRPGSRGSIVEREYEVAERIGKEIIAVDASGDIQTFSDKQILKWLVRGDLSVKRWVEF